MKKEAGQEHKPRVSVGRSIFVLVDDRDRAYFGRGREENDQIGFIDKRGRLQPLRFDFTQPQRRRGMSVVCAQRP
jgi:hypothetical protein